MSYIEWRDTTTGDTCLISGAERHHLAMITLAASGLPYGAHMGAMLNAAMVARPNLRLAARIHGQCELGAYVVPSDRAWMAAMIRRSVEDVIEIFDREGSRYESVFRVGMSCYAGSGGWWRLHDWLLRPDGGRVVLSYSTSGHTPNRGPAWLRMQPKGWDSYTFFAGGT